MKYDGVFKRLESHCMCILRNICMKMSKTLKNVYDIQVKRDNLSFIRLRQLDHTSHTHKN